jgi:hypothetical protein
MPCLGIYSAAQITAVFAHEGTWSLPVTRALKREIDQRAATGQQIATGLVDSKYGGHFDIQP